MQYVLTFIEGIITFISPCLLPMLPIYILYFAGGENTDNSKKHRALINSLGFVLGFTILFVAMGAFAASIGSLFRQHQTAVNIVTGLIVIIFGLNFTGILKIGFLNFSKKSETSIKPMGFFSSVLFGIIFSIGWTPCVGAFLGSALMIASQTGSLTQGIILLLLYSLGLGIPFVISAVLIDKLKGAFNFIKRNYTIINIICGVLLIVVGAMMMTGIMQKIFTLVSF